jgi:hypothetical protein
VYLHIGNTSPPLPGILANVIQKTIKEEKKYLSVEGKGREKKKKR